jgi:aldose 1-epimerase
MFDIQRTAFGKYETITLSTADGRSALSVVPGFGSCVIGLTLNGKALLDTYQTADEMNINRWAKNVFLFPFPNRLKHGQYNWEGQIYQFPVNDAPTNNALHGFGMDKPMEVVQASAGPDKAILVTAYRYDGSLEAYPFPFELEIAFSLSPTAFAVEMKVTNTGTQSLPFGMGWHPYFQLTEKVDELYLELPPCDMIGVDASMIPTGKRYEYTTFTRARRVGPEVLDNCFALRQKQGNIYISMKGDGHEIRYWQEVGERKFPFVQLFTPPHRRSLAVEPMSCNIDAFNNGDGLWKLMPGEMGLTRFGVEC